MSAVPGSAIPPAFLSQLPPHLQAVFAAQAAGKSRALSDSAFRLEQLRIQTRSQGEQAALQAKKSLFESLKAEAIKEPGMTEVAKTNLARIGGSEFSELGGDSTAARITQDLEIKASREAGVATRSIQERWSRHGLLAPAGGWDAFQKKIETEIGANPGKGAASAAQDAAELELNKALDKRRFGRFGKGFERRAAAAGVSGSLVPGLTEEFVARAQAGDPLQRAAGETIKSGRRATNIGRAKVGGKIALGAGIGGLLLSKMFGQKDDAVPPELQMAMMQRLQGGGGLGGAAQAADNQATTGRELMNMSRAMAMIKMMNDMTRMQGAPQPTSARIV